MRRLFQHRVNATLLQGQYVVALMMIATKLFCYLASKVISMDYGVKE